ncbi:pyridoxal phosphate-dependent aminotransferase [Streptomyces sp. NBC_00513]|uniref:pyridoxal phosphate-dependent aminotransferase n=1 Tax=unclassified Streptomyces TaxID=2593676 RepID=UPI00224FB2F5|nr:pyridoxal phosphate-dependent aminotransferase [Streptomyces sp. NBC_00424]MCX5071086.1 pyridoxal phosphate-dependent aminotransferase [Streptomyces sp. NBC_00424]WUD45490.1 pyridoxal phosphate-dependent aminotransferase [Streptomyces sp. NBC_00513]
MTDNPHSYKWTMYPGKIPLSFGDMDFDPDPRVLDAIQERMKWPLAYPPPHRSSGVAKRIGDYYLDHYGLHIPSDSLWLGTGCLSQSFHVLRSLAAQGDEVLYWSPAFKHIRSAIEASGATPVPLDAGPAISHTSLEEAITPRTRAVYLVNPHNPTGRSYSRPELEAVRDVAERHGLVVVTNELHSRLVLDGQHVPFASLGGTAAELSITLSGASKSHNLAAVGGSFAFSHSSVLLGKVMADSAHYCQEATGLQQAALSAAYDGDSPWLLDARDRLRQARDHLISALHTGLPRLKIRVPQATYFIWADFSAYLSAGESAHQVLDEQCGVIAAAGESFGAPPTWARLSYSLTDDVLARAARLIIAGLTHPSRSPEPTTASHKEDK